MAFLQPHVGRRGFIAGLVACGIPAVAVAAVADGRSPRPAEGEVGGIAPLLATVYSGQVDPALCLVSEKYDGVRALWDGRMLRHRSGRVVAAPAAFLAALPGVALDGELWLGRGRFDTLSSLVRRAEPRPADWSNVRYMAFELPNAGGTFAERATRLAERVAHFGPGPTEAAPQRRVPDGAALQRLLDTTVAAGGEGLMLHLASAPVANGRSGALMKLKPHLDAEAVVVGFRAGAGKYRGQVGALEVESADGRRFFIGSGLDDASRRDPPPSGSVVTYRYRSLTATGLPRFATFVRRHHAF